MYTPNEWKSGDIITAERMNRIEQAIANEQVGPAGPQGPQGEQGPKGDSGEGLTGVAAAIEAVAADADAAALAAKLNEVIAALSDRGVLV